MKTISKIKPATNPPSPSETPLEKHEWDFNDVPDAELVACCYWEYARESAVG